MKKKLLAILFTTIFSLSLISCSQDISENNNTNTNENNTTSSDNVDNDSNEQSNSSENNDSDKENTENEIIKENVNIYYYDVVTDKIVYVPTTIEIKNKEVATALVNELKKSPTEDIPPAINENITLKSANLDKNSDVITLDFSSNFVKEQNLGAGAESSTLEAICNTFGDYFKVNKVIITLEGKPYSSGHIMKNEGESFNVNLTNSVELTK